MPKLIILGVVGLSIILGILFWLLSSGGFHSGGPSSSEPITLTVWGLRDLSPGLKSAIDNYQKLHPKVTINYVHQSTTNYRTRVQTQIANGQGPDILAIHNSWVTMFLRSHSLAVMPANTMSINDFSKTFYPVAISSFTSDNQIYGLPAEIDGLALYYNQDMLAGQGLTPPALWNDFVSEAVRLTVLDQNGQIVTAGAALGTSTNVDHWSDILGLLFLQQPQADISKPGSQDGGDVLTFYTNFVKSPKQRTWDANFLTSTQAFEQGKLAFYFGPAWEGAIIKAANPSLKFKVAPVPQLPGNKPINWANFWGWGVAANSAHNTEAWDFLKYLSSKDVDILLNDSPYARVDLQTKQTSSPTLGAYVIQAPTDSFWYLESDTFDAGINEEMIASYSKAVSAVLSGTAPQDALNDISGDLGQTLDKYTAIPTASPGK